MWKSAIHLVHYMSQYLILSPKTRIILYVEISYIKSKSMHYTFIIAFCVISRWERFDKKKGVYENLRLWPYVDVQRVHALPFFSMS